MNKFLGLKLDREAKMVASRLGKMPLGMCCTDSWEKIGWLPWGNLYLDGKVDGQQQQLGAGPIAHEGGKSSYTEKFNNGLRCSPVGGFEDGWAKVEINDGGNCSQSMGKT
jgi:hypothetical protein